MKNNTIQHTPGPWNIAPHDHANTIWAVNGGICDVFHGNEDDDRTASVENKEEADVNARLIAAAPELLAALIELERVESSPHSETTRYLAREQAREVITKATGRNV